VLRFLFRHIFKEITHIKTHFANVATVTGATATTTCARLTKRHSESETIYIITDVHTVTHLSLPNRCGAVKNKWSYTFTLACPVCVPT
jgi:hypothetical protein